MILFNHLFELDPVPWQRVAHVSGRMIVPAETRAFKKTFATLAKYFMGARPPLDGPLAAEICFYLRRPERFKGREYPDIGYDCDNLVKSVLDAGNKIIWEDDGRIISLSIQKHWSDWSSGQGHILLQVSNVGVKDG